MPTCISKSKKNKSSTVATNVTPPLAPPSPATWSLATFYTTTWHSYLLQLTPLVALARSSATSSLAPGLLSHFPSPHLNHMPLRCTNVSLHFQAWQVFCNLPITIGPSANLAAFSAIHTLSPPHPSPPFKPADSASLNLLRHTSTMPPIASVINPLHIFHIPLYTYQLLPMLITIDTVIYAVLSIGNDRNSCKSI